jgi:hypothetical protein
MVLSRLAALPSSLFRIHLADSGITAAQRHGENTSESGAGEIGGCSVRVGVRMREGRIGGWFEGGRVEGRTEESGWGLQTGRDRGGGGGSAQPAP